jgi:hypothetical protein
LGIGKKQIGHWAHSWQFFSQHIRGRATPTWLKYGPVGLITSFFLKPSSRRLRSTFISKTNLHPLDHPSQSARKPYKTLVPLRWENPSHYVSRAPHPPQSSETFVRWVPFRSLLLRRILTLPFDFNFAHLWIIFPFLCFSCFFFGQIYVEVKNKCASFEPNSVLLIKISLWFYFVFKRFNSYHGF